jgi:hypothetical protein
MIGMVGGDGHSNGFFCSVQWHCIVLRDCEGIPGRFLRARLRMNQILKWVMNGGWVEDDSLLRSMVLGLWEGDYGRLLRSGIIDISQISALR